MKYFYDANDRMVGRRAEYAGVTSNPTETDWKLEDRATVIGELRRLRLRYSKLQMLDGMLNVYARPPQSPSDCIFAQTTECFSSDFEHRIAPCQFGGKPDCQNCGCMASAGLEAIGRHRLRGGLTVGKIFYASLAVGRTVARVRRAVSPA